MSTALLPDITSSLKSLTRNLDYKNVLLIDSTGKVRGNLSESGLTLGNNLEGCYQIC